MVFSVASDKIRKDAMALGKGLTFKQVYDLAKADKSSKTQMKIISKGDKKFDLHVVRRASGYSTQKPPPKQNFKHQTPNADQSKKESTERKPLRL